MGKYKYNIVNLDCANCARRIEDNLNKNDMFCNVNVNFSTSKISYESNKEIDIKELNKIVRKIEPNATILEELNYKHTKEYKLHFLILGTFFGLIGIYLELPWYFNEVMIVLSYVFLLYKTFLNAVKLLFKSKTINENLLITISCIGAYLVGQHTEGIMVIFLYLLGKILEEKAINNTRKSINDLVNIKQDYANKKYKNEIKKVDIEEIKVGDILVVKKGERIPVDSIIVKGSGRLDTSALTGESDLLKVEIGTKVLSGSINIDEILEIRVESEFKDSTVARILELLEEATEKKAKTETFISKISKIYTPVVLVLAVLVVVLFPLFTNLSFNDSLYRGLTFLVISCPCAIAISVPLSYFTGIGVSSKNGILIKGSNYLDTLSHLNKIVFDKTGTLTTGSFEVKSIEIHDKNYSKEEVIDIIVKGESLSNHPVARSIMLLTNKKVNNKDIRNYKETSGEGISFDLGSKKIKIGTHKLCGCNFETDVHLNIDGKHVASIEINDGIKENAFESIKSLKKLNILTYMFTGDKKDVASEIGNKLELDDIKYEMLPTDKYHEYEMLKKENDIIAFVGDGINDAPVLKRSDIGISMGGIGSSAAIEASDVVIMNDDLTKIPKAISISKYTKYIIKQNLIFAIGFKLLILVLSMFGEVTMWLAVFADTGVTILTILNTLRIMAKYRHRG